MGKPPDFPLSELRTGALSSFSQAAARICAALPGAAWVILSNNPPPRDTVTNNEKRGVAPREYHMVHMEIPYPIHYKEMGNWKGGALGGKGDVRAPRKRMYAQRRNGNAAVSKNVPTRGARWFSLNTLRMSVSP